MKVVKIILIFIVACPVYVLGQCFTFTITTTPESCLGCCDGSISVTNLTGGCPPYQLTWSPSANGGACSGITYTLTIKDAGSCCQDSSVQVQVPVSTTDINQILLNKVQLSVYPNPTSNSLNVTLTKNEESCNIIKLINVMGQIVFFKNISKNKGVNEVINLSDFAKGVYLLTITNDANTIYKKVIIE